MTPLLHPPMSGLWWLGALVLVVSATVIGAHLLHIVRNR